MPPITDSYFPPEPSVDAPDDKYNIKLPVFEGPIDLLLFLIRKKELDIHEIALSAITKEYLEYVEMIKKIDIEKAGEFIVVAAILMKIKSKSLFEGEGDQEDITLEAASSAIIEYLLEYEKLGGAAVKLAEKEEERRKVFPRGGEKTKAIKNVNKMPDLHLSDLMTALKDILKSAPRKNLHEIEYFSITVEMKQKEILTSLKNSKKLDFSEFVKGQNRYVVIVTFIALLELVKNGLVGCRQASQFGRITLYRMEDDKGNN